MTLIVSFTSCLLFFIQNDISVRVQRSQIHLRKYHALPVQVAFITESITKLLGNEYYDFLRYHTFARRDCFSLQEEMMSSAVYHEIGSISSAV